MSSRPHKNLKIWKKSINLVHILYEILKDFPGEEKFGIIGQLQRAAISLPANISEGAARRTEEFYHFLSIATGSLSEIDTLIEISYKLELLNNENYKMLFNKVEKTDALLRGLMKNVKLKINS